MNIQTNKVFPRLLFLLALVALLFAISPAREAKAAFPGQNGKLLFNDSSFDNDSGKLDFLLKDIHLDGSGVRNLDTSTRNSATEADFINQSDASYSADGSKIVYSMFDTANNTTNLYIINSDGSGRQQLTFLDSDSTKAATRPRFSPDGSKIIYTEELRDEYITQTYLINSDGSGRSLLSIAGSDNCDTAPVISPNGNKIAFYRHLNTEPEGTVGVYTANIDGTNSHKLVNILSGSYCSNATLPLSVRLDWSPDGSKLIFGVNTPSEDENFIDNYIKTVEVANPGNVQIIQSHRISGSIAEGDIWSTGAVYTPDGHIIFNRTLFSANEQDEYTITSSIVLVNDDGSNMVTIPGTTKNIPTEQGSLQLYNYQSINIQPIPIEVEPSTENSVNFQSIASGEPVSLQTPDETTITCSTSIKESTQAEQDGIYDYPLGLVEFCFDTENTNNQVSLTFVTDLTPDQVKARKYNSTSGIYFDITGATISQITYQNQPALQLTYTITDNGQLDLDPATGSIKDPVGLAVNDSDGGLAQTGENLFLVIIPVSISTLGFGAYIVYRRRIKISGV